jgi:hypothetical protein
VGSFLGDAGVAAFHFLPELCSGPVAAQAVDSDVEAWHYRSFHRFSGGELSSRAVVDVLLSCGAVTEAAGRIVATPLGRIASSMYFHPCDVDAWRSNFSRLFEEGLEEDDKASAWALGNVPVSRASGDLGGKWFVASVYRDEVPGSLPILDGAILGCVLWWSVLGGPSVGPMNGMVRQMREDGSRVVGDLRRVDRDVARWERGDYFDRLEMQMRRSLPVELVPLCALPRVGKGLATFLYEVGVTCPEDVVRESGHDGPASDEEIGAMARELADGMRA